MNYYPFHIGDYRSATMHLTNDEDLAYRRLLDFYYDTETPIPLDTQQVSRRLRVGAQHIETVLKDFFKHTQDGWIHERCDVEIAEYKARAERSRANGKNGGRRKSLSALEKNLAETQQVPAGNPAPTQPLANQEPRTKNQEPVTKSGEARKRATRRCPDSFDLTDELRDWAVENAPAVDVDLATAKFRDHTFKNAITDWVATWRNWMRRDQEAAATRPAARQPAESFKERDERRARERWEEITGRRSAEAIDVTPSFLGIES